MVVTTTAPALSTPNQQATSHGLFGPRSSTRLPGTDAVLVDQDRATRLPSTGASRWPACIREALACRESGEEKVILTALCGHGHFDMPAYAAYLAGEMVDEDVTDERLAPLRWQALPTVPA